MKVYLAVPRLGSPEFECTMALLMSSVREDAEVCVDSISSSLLAFGFNRMWCKFANDPSYDYMVMLHSDHGPQVRADIKKERPQLTWLELLIEELEAEKCQAMHAVAAIKDVLGTTSTALGHRDAKFEPVRRITVRELMKLPDTFTTKDCVEGLDWFGQQPNGRALLPNTGVLAIKREGFPFEKFPGFCITDAVQRDAEGKYVALVEPEDWAFGRWCAREGLRVGGTKKVVTHHYGRSDFHTEEPWGMWERDENWAYHTGVANGRENAEELRRRHAGASVCPPAEEKTEVQGRDV